MAPPLLTLRGARVGFGGEPVFSDLDVQLGRGERVCLVGRNGSGKTTLMRALLGEIELDAGERFAQPGLDTAYLPQDPVFEPEMTAADYVAKSGRPGHEIEAAMDRLGVDGDRRLGTLSGGEGRRAALARAFAGEPDILMLDEPTNHLDLATIEWLERTLAAFKGAILVVSHDRAFLNRVTTGTWWLDRGRVRQSDQGFAAFDSWSMAVLKAEEKEAKRLDVAIAQDTRWLLRGITARRKRNQGRLRKLEEMRSFRATLLGGRGKLKLKAEDGDLRSRMVIEARKIAKRFPVDGADEEKIIVDGFSTRILRGDRIGIIGANGSGKTTLLQLLTGQIDPDRGTVRVAKHLKRAYFDQHRAVLDRKKSLKQTLCEGGGDTVWVQGRSRHVVGYLKDFLFDPAQADSPVGSLSGGERNRLLLAKILATRSDLLVLDEPTNDLDMDTLDLLEDVLSDYAGTLLLVSHDRDFLDRIVASTIAMEGDGTAVEYPGGYSDYFAQRKVRPGGASTSGSGSAAPRDQPRGAAARKRPDRQRTRLGYKDQRELDLLPGRIAGLEDEIARLEATLADSALYERDRKTFEQATRRLAAAKDELAAAEESWLALEARREALAGAEESPAG